MIKLGKISLVDAGPGAPELLTIKAIAQANVILIDELVDPEILTHACADARIVKVGKRGGWRSTPQEFIERLMIAEAHMGQNVVRLKGDDRFMPGRGDEEREHLQKAGIAVDVIARNAGLSSSCRIVFP